jgi:hypothetical protein
MNDKDDDAPRPDPFFLPKKPCVEKMCEGCPFSREGLTRGKNDLGDGEFERIKGIVRLGMAFYCHDTVWKDPRTQYGAPVNGEPVPVPNQEHFRSCLGAFVYKRTGKLPT